MKALLEKQAEIRRRIDELCHDPEASRVDDRRGWLARSQPVFEELARANKLIEEVRELLVGFADRAIVLVISLCESGDSREASRLLRLVDLVLSGLYSQPGVSLHELQSYLIEIKKSAPTLRLEPLGLMLENVKEFETEATTSLSS